MDYLKLTNLFMRIGKISGFAIVGAIIMTFTLIVPDFGWGNPLLVLPFLMFVASTLVGGFCLLVGWVLTKLDTWEISLHWMLCFIGLGLGVVGVVFRLLNANTSPSVIFIDIFWANAHIWMWIGAIILLILGVIDYILTK